MRLAGHVAPKEKKVQSPCARRLVQTTDKVQTMWLFAFLIILFNRQTSRWHTQSRYKKWYDNVELLMYDLWAMKPARVGLIIRDGDVENLSSVTSVETIKEAGAENWHHDE